MISGKNIDKTMNILKKISSAYKPPVLERFAYDKKDPYWVLIPCLLSLRARDETTAVVSEKLFAAAPAPAEIMKLPRPKLEKIIYKSGFYRNKAKAIHETTKMLIEKYSGKVPDSLEELLKLPGVGRKTANLVVTAAFNKPGICVDTHVHRITNRWGYVDTKNADKTEMRLREILPKKYWIKINYHLVLFGQNICLPVSPYCSRCPLRGMCPQKNVRTPR
ncbi:MAG: endonuclease III domain-containing protein [Candidatus Goldiibacteriota bacterium]